MESLVNQNLEYKNTKKTRELTLSLESDDVGENSDYPSDSSDDIEEDSGDMKVLQDLIK